MIWSQSVHIKCLFYKVCAITPQGSERAFSYQIWLPYSVSIFLGISNTDSFSIDIDLRTKSWKPDTIACPQQRRSFQQLVDQGSSLWQSSKCLLEPWKLNGNGWCSIGHSTFNQFNNFRTFFRIWNDLLCGDFMLTFCCCFQANKT